MQLYKFMSLEPFEHVADALLGRRLYCPKPDQLNDPLEGMLGHHIESAEGGKPLDDQLRAGFVSRSRPIVISREHVSAAFRLVQIQCRCGHTMQVDKRAFALKWMFLVPRAGLSRLNTSNPPGSSRDKFDCR
jgi:hypothetical protein